MRRDEADLLSTRDPRAWLVRSWSAVLAVLLVLGVSTAAGGGAGVARGQPAPPSFVDSVQVDGLVVQPRRFTRDDLAGLSPWSMPVVFAAGPRVQSATFTGASLLKVIQAAGGPVVDPSRNNDLLRKYVVASGADGYDVVIAWAEIDPAFGGQPIFVAYERDGQPLSDGEGLARLVVPGDKRGGRRVNRLARLELRDVGGPATTG